MLSTESDRVVNVILDGRLSVLHHFEASRASLEAANFPAQKNGLMMRADVLNYVATCQVRIVEVWRTMEILTA